MHSWENYSGWKFRKDGELASNEKIPGNWLGWYSIAAFVSKVDSNVTWLLTYNAYSYKNSTVWKVYGNIEWIECFSLNSDSDSKVWKCLLLFFSERKVCHKSQLFTRVGISATVLG